ncbi:DUF3566 domain-containing protein [Corynebacterium vitaeruminis]|uniref:DUF3566 domain-containing protein n=1 Tax=Corynebacterium vitaeruminis DSM 20294 TaxID=1224164 RepID=W5Y4L8_9CORY|nr:DUF3566 domain-containing protein [Corynebacterium vitaeruminis]AHI21413.1 hypothetical protein B843_00085 [Corynebacterium vitaeruminis DSM 20294]
MANRKVAIRYVSPLSAFKTALSLSLVGLAAWVICVVLLYFVMGAAGVWDNVNEIIGGVGGSQGITFGLVLSLASLIGAIGAIIVSVLAPLTAVVYNAIVDLFGGLVVSLSDDGELVG